MENATWQIVCTDSGVVLATVKGTIDEALSHAIVEYPLFWTIIKEITDELH